VLLADLWRKEDVVDRSIPLQDHSPQPRHRDANPIRKKAFKTACATAKAEYFDNRYTNGHMFLKLLVCHPGHRRRGAGTALVKWGTTKAAQWRLNTTLLASPMGETLYTTLGFVQLGRFRVEVEGETDFLDIPAMVFTFRNRQILRRANTVS
jgi:GNAT superfamily N-acetyltransferase